MPILISASIFNVFLSAGSPWPSILHEWDLPHIELSWLESHLREAPALTVAIALSLLVPVLAVTGSLLRLAFPGAASSQADFAGQASRPIEVRPVHQRAFLELQRHDTQPFEIRHSIVRIGRETDNEVQLTDPSVHRYHAVIERTFEGEYHIAYVGAVDGNGLRINGRKVNRHRLTSGEILDIGTMKLRFTTVDA